MNQIYQVVLSAEDGEYPLSDWQTRERAELELERIEDHYGDGQELFIRSIVQGL